MDFSAWQELRLYEPPGRVAVGIVVEQKFRAPAQGNSLNALAVQDDVRFAHYMSLTRFLLYDSVSRNLGEQHAAP